MARLHSSLCQCCPDSGIQQALSVLHAAVKPGGYLPVSMAEADLDDAADTYLDAGVRGSGYQRADRRLSSESS
ncbi:hypothetical protein HLB23_09115 [Nocardia uniformis]|uniref:Uncharacterized protein n=1 Tax=Nocardia uniformis TaxID=53432 RepID=A0A849C0J5_9NOCA|nr:hypothetical protein [Nocardia uniformis]NNH70020.1 hypothetical protein [Nocardia uniformis]